MTRTIIISLFLLSLTACGGSDPADKSTAKLDAVEVQPGTISDSMIILDDAASDGTAIDNSVPDDGKKKESAKAEDDAAEEGSTEAPGEAETAAAVEAPVVKKTIAEPAIKKGD